jgi:hypothetical protein
MNIWECVVSVGLKGRVNIFTLLSSDARQFFGDIDRIFLYERNGLVHLSAVEADNSIVINLFKKNKRHKRGILRKVSFAIPGNTETGERLRGLAGRRSLGRLQFDGRDLYIYPEAIVA